MSAAAHASPTTFFEVETKFSVPDAVTPPELTRIEVVARVAERKTHRLSAIYYDTADLRLTRSKITLRRREGGDDDGWHIKIPAAGGRTEIHAPIQAPIDGIYQVPEELLAQVRAIVRREELKPIAQVDNERMVSLLADDVGDQVAEFSDDHVTAFSFLGAGAQQSWNEWELELHDKAVGTELGSQLLHSATTLLVSAGARVSSSPSKLVMALGDTTNDVPLPLSKVDADIDEDSPAAAVIAALKLNRDKLHDYDPRVRRDEFDSVHQMRVATRELRSHMETFNGILGGEDMIRIESELKLLAAMLGVARDAEVVEERFLMLLDSEDSGVLDEETRAHLREDMGAEYRRAHRRVIATLDSDRYLDLLDDIDQLLAYPPVVGTTHHEPESDPTTEVDAAADLDMIAEGGFGEPGLAVSTDGFDPTEDTTADEKAMVAEGGHVEHTDQEFPAPGTSAEPVEVERLLYEHLTKAYTKLLKRHKKAVDNWDNSELTLHQREEYFHDMRKSAKKLRYAAEATGAATSLKTKRLYNACKAMQSSLGDFQDSVTSRDRLLKLAEHAHRRGENTFGYGVLYQRERTIGLRALDAYAEEVKAIKSAYKRLAEQVKEAENKKAKAAKQAKKVKTAKDEKKNR